MDPSDKMKTIMSCQKAKPAKNPWQKTPMERNILWKSRLKSSGVLLGFNRSGSTWLPGNVDVSFLWVVERNPPSFSKNTLPESWLGGNCGTIGEGVNLGE